MESDRCLQQGGQIRRLARGGPLQPCRLSETIRETLDQSAVMFGGVGKPGPEGQGAMKFVPLDPDPAL